MPKTNEPDLRLPKQKIRDATGTGGLRKSYQTQLNTLYGTYNTHLQSRVGRLLDRSTEPDGTIKAGFMKEFIEKIDATDEHIMKPGSRPIIEEHITRAFKRGKEVAAANPRLERESIVIPSRLSRTDNLVIEDMKIRNFNLINDDSIKKKLLQIISEDIRQGKGTAQIAKDLENNIIDLGKTRSKMIARTEIAFSYNNAIAKTYMDAEITKWQWLTAMGDTVCPDCAARHGNTYDWGDEQPPIHPNCLCTIYPVVDREFKK